MIAFISPLLQAVVERRCAFLSGAMGLGIWCESNNDARCRLCEQKFCAAHMTGDLCESCILAMPAPQRGGRR